MLKKIFVIFCILGVLIFNGCFTDTVKSNNTYDFNIVIDILSHEEMDEKGVIIATHLLIFKGEDGKCKVNGHMEVRPNLENIDIEMEEILTKAEKICFAGD